MSEILHAKGKIYKSHACGWVKHLLPMMKDSGLDAIEAFAVEPIFYIPFSNLSALKP